MNQSLRKAIRKTTNKRLLSNNSTFSTSNCQKNET